MFALFHDEEYDLAMADSGPAAVSPSQALNHVRRAPAATASTADGSDSARSASGSFGLLISSDLQLLSAAATARALSARTNRIVCIGVDLLVKSERSPLRSRART